MSIVLQPGSIDTIAAAATRAMPHSMADRLLEEAWADPWTRSLCRRSAEAALPGTASIDDDAMFDLIRHQIHCGVLSITGPAPTLAAPDAPKRRPAKATDTPRMLLALEAGRGNGAWPNIQRTEFALGLRRRVGRPSLIHQRDTSLCGPSSLCYNLLQYDVDAYVRYAIDLYETGAAMIGKTKVKPGESCRNYRPTGQEVQPPPARLGGPSVAKTNTAITAVDWVTTASLRDSENLLFNYDDPSDEFGGITLPNNLATWMENLGYTGVSNETNVWFTKRPDAFQDAVRLRQQGQHVCIFNNARLVDGKETESHVYSVPDHWIVLDDSNGVFNGRLAARFWTWGSYIDVPKRGNMDAGTFCGNFFGYVAGTPPG